MGKRKIPIHSLLNFQFMTGRTCLHFTFDWPAYVRGGGGLNLPKGIIIEFCGKVLFCS